MIYLERNQNNRYSIRIQNTIFKDHTDEIEGKVFHVLLVNTVTKESYEPVFTITRYEPYFQGTITHNLSDGEYEYSLYFTENDTAEYIESGLLRIGDFSDAKMVDVYDSEKQTGDIVYNS